MLSRISRVAQRYLGVIQEQVPVVLPDDYSIKAVRTQCRDAEVHPRSRYSLAFNNPAQKTDRRPVPRVAARHLELFVERLVQSRKGYMEMPA